MEQFYFKIAFATYERGRVDDKAPEALPLPLQCFMIVCLLLLLLLILLLLLGF